MNPKPKPKPWTFRSADLRFLAGAAKSRAVRAYSDDHDLSPQAHKHALLHLHSISAKQVFLSRPMTNCAQHA